MSFSMATAPGPDAALANVRFDGRVSRDDDDIDAAASDFGGIYRHRPLAVLSPASVDDIVRAVGWARTWGVTVAARGRGHSTAGQSQAAGGLVVDMASLSAIRAVGDDWMEVEAGATWKEVLDEALSRGLMPPVVPDYLGLSVGGTIALGGLGYQTCRYGTIVDNVAELLVVTGTGKIVVCSARVNPDLFVAARGGLGHFGIVGAVRLRMIPAPARIRLDRLLYTDLALLLEDLERLGRSPEPYDTIAAFAIPNEPEALRTVLRDAADGLWFAPWMFRRLFILQIGRYVPANAVSEPLSELQATGCVPDVVHRWTEPFASFADRAMEHHTAWKASGLWDAAHPWLDVILPGDVAEQWLAETLDALDPADPADGPVMMYPMMAGRSRGSFLQLPASDYCVRVDVLRSVLPESPRTALQLIESNRERYARAVAGGAVHYPSGALDLTDDEWRAHFSRVWDAFRRARAAYDPARMFSPCTCGGGLTEE